MSALFQPFRALGYITDNVPFAVQRRGKETFVTVSVGKAWQVYKCAKLSLALVGPELPHNIRALACHRDLTFAAVRSSIIECSRVHRSGVYKSHSDDIIQLLVLGDLLLSLGLDRRLLVWRIGQYDEPEVEIQLDQGFVPTCMAHPDTYVNKIVIGSISGQLQLWNFVSGKLLFTFDIASCAVRCIAPSPALDVLGIGLADGRAVLHNLRYNEQVVSFANASGVGAKASLMLDPVAARGSGGGACTAISFRTGAGTPLMAAGGGSGAVTVWNLEERRLQTIIRSAHDAPLLSLHFFAGEPRLMSSAADNSVKQWLFDAADGAGRLLRFRSGHSAPPTCLAHYGEGKRLLSAGQDRAFRMFSVIQDQQSRELSQKHIERRAKRLKIDQSELKLPRVVSMDACQVRERDWCNVITAHDGDTAAYTWRLQHFTLGDHVLKPSAKKERGKDSLPDAPVTTVAMSSCGNYGLVGTAAGRVDRYNMQSGIHRGAYTRRDSSGSHQNAHTGTVVGIAVDSCNRSMVTAGIDGWLRVWDFKKRTLSMELEIGCAVNKLAAHSGSALVAVACDDLVLRMYDVEAGRLVRQFRGHKDRITDVAISADGRWLLSSSMDGTLRVWDIPASRTLQVLRLGSSVTALSLAPNQELLATTHVSRRGIYLWANQHIFGGAADVMPSEVPIDARLPTLATGVADEEEAEAELATSSEEEDDDETAEVEPEPVASPSGQHADGVAAEVYQGRDRTGAPVPLVPQLVTLSMLPRTQWQTLVHLDAIKERNKPIQPPKKPEAAPFFLPTVPGLSRVPVFDTPAASADAPKGVEGALPGWGDSEGGDVGEEAADGEPKAGSADGTATAKRKGGKAGKPARQKLSRVLQNVEASAESDFLRELRAGAAANDFSALVARLREMSPNAVDTQLRSMQVVDLDTADPEEVADLERLLQFMQTEVTAGRSFEHVQALLRATLAVHGDTILAHEGLREHASILQTHLATSWNRLDSLMQSVRCLVNFLGKLPS